MRSSATKVIKKESGIMYKIVVCISPFEALGGEVDYEVYLYKKKQHIQSNYINISNNINFYDKMLKTEKEVKEIQLKMFLQFVTIEDIEETKQKLWESLKPNQIKKSC